MKPREIPLGISDDYDDLPSTHHKVERRCQGCDQHFIDHMRVAADGFLICAIFCPTCRWVGRIRRRHQDGNW